MQQRENDISQTVTVKYNKLLSRLNHTSASLYVHENLIYYQMVRNSDAYCLRFPRGMT